MDIGLDQKSIQKMLIKSERVMQVVVRESRNTPYVSGVLAFNYRGYGSEEDKITRSLRRKANRSTGIIHAHEDFQ